MVVGETGSELDVEVMPAKKAKKGGGRNDVNTGKML